MPSLPRRLLDLLSPAARSDRRNVDSLARKLGLPSAEAEAIYRRARQVGFGAAMTERRDRAEAKAGVAEEP